MKRILKEGLIEAPIFEILNKMRIRQEPKGILLYGPSGKLNQWFLRNGFEICIKLIK